MALVHERLKEKRIEARLSLSEASRRSGLARSYIHQLEAAHSVPTIDKLQALAAVYDTSVSYLIGETGGVLASMRVSAHRRLNAAIWQLEDAIISTKAAMELEAESR